MLIRLFGLLLVGTLVTAQSENTTCADINRWGPPDCQNVCGECFQPTLAPEVRKCDVKTGVCPHGCTGNYKEPLCDEATCENNCNGGLCIAPGICANCVDINKVAPNCEDIRLRGLIGSAISFVVVLSSVALCGFGSVWYKRRSNSAVAL